MDLWQAIKRDHARVATLFMNIRQTGSNRKRLIEHLQQELAAHARGEEEVLYPALAEIAGFKDMVGDSLAEHEAMRKLLEQIAAAPEDAMPLLDELQEVVADHVAEEESQLIPAAQKVLSEQNAHEMLRRFEAVKAAAKTPD